MSIFVLFVKQNPYWLILLVPYVILTMITNMDKFRDNVILECIFSMGFILQQAYERNWCYSFDMFTKMTGIDPQIEGYYDVCGFVGIIDRLQEMTGVSAEHIISVLVCCFVLGLILFLYENRPGIQCFQEVDFERVRCISWIRIIPALGVALLPFITAFYYFAKVLLL